MVISFLLIGVILGLVDSLLVRSFKLKTIVKLVVIDFFIVNLLSLSILRFLLGKENILSYSRYTYLFSMKYMAFALVIGAIFICIKLIFKGIITFKVDQNKFNLKSGFLFIGILLLFSIGLLLFFGSKWFISFFGEITPEQFIFNFYSPVTGTAGDMQQKIIETPVLALATSIGIFLVMYLPGITVYYQNKKIISSTVRRGVLGLVALMTFVVGIGYSISELKLNEVYTAYVSDSTYVKDNYARPVKKNVDFPKEKRNLIHIYLESYENSYFDKQSGGYMEQSLMPDLQELAKEGISFSESDKFGGPFQTYGSSWSVASMINIGAGLPLKIPMEGNDYGKSGQFLPGAVTLGDILASEGYEQTIMFGADADFGGLTSFFKTHGDYKIHDVKYAREQRLIPQDYNVWWGYEDKKLFDFAKEELVTLSNSGKPFNLTMENADTHFPDGYIEPDTPKPYDSQYANVIAHSQKQVVEFVRWIQEQPFYDNTTIVLTGDHLSMDKAFFANFDPSYHRTTFNLFLNADIDTQTANLKNTNRKYGPFDYFPTILSSLGVKIDGNKLGLGTDLFSNQKTLLEKNGEEFFNTELSKKSNFYNNEFVNEGKKVDY